MKTLRKYAQKQVQGFLGGSTCLSLLRCLVFLTLFSLPGASAAMAARSALWNPSVFSPEKTDDWQVTKKKYLKEVAFMTISWISLKILENDLCVMSHFCFSAFFGTMMLS